MATSTRVAAAFETKACQKPKSKKFISIPFVSTSVPHKELGSAVA
jgi:hypothetical protein